MTPRKRIVLLALAMMVLVGLPLLGHWVRRGTIPGCALDGMPIIPLYRVEIIDNEGRRYEFCCIRCAQLWFDRHPGSRSVHVTDEEQGVAIPALSAYYVRSGVITNPTTKNRIHAFRHESAARRHADSYHGIILSDRESPFASPSE